MLKLILQPLSIHLDAESFLTLTEAKFFVATDKITQQLFLRPLPYLQIDLIFGAWRLVKLGAPQPFPASGLDCRPNNQSKVPFCLV